MGGESISLVCLLLLLFVLILFFVLTEGQWRSSATLRFAIGPPYVCPSLRRLLLPFFAPLRFAFLGIFGSVLVGL